MDALTVHLEGIGFWSPQWADWNGAARALRGEAPGAPAAAKPAAAILAPGERRRAPDLILLACEVAGQACAAARLAAADLPCVFAATNGDVATADAICATLAGAPLDVSPTRFHNSVHNAAAGYWTVATGCRAASTALAAGTGTFAAALLEAALQSLADERPVLLAAGDAAASNPLGEVLRADATLGLAFVLGARRGATTQATLRLRHDDTPSTQEEGGGVAAALPLLRTLARGEPALLRLPYGMHGSLAVEVAA